jgi:spoIIIJ-associated protein
MPETKYTPYRFTNDGKLDRAALVAELRRFLNLLIDRTKLNLRYEIREAAAGGEAELPEVNVILHGADEPLVLQHNAELLFAIEYVALRWLRLDPHFYDHIQIDCAGYHATRLAELKMSAKLAAEKVVSTRESFRFNPMSARERRIVHIALKDFAGVRTESEGMGDRRQVVIHPA